MKILSKDVVTRDDLSNMDTKQNKQINQLRWAVGICFVLNLAFTLAIVLL